MDQNQSPKAIVITPTIGNPLLTQTIESVQEQSYKDLLHLIVVDGECFLEDTLRILNQCNPDRYKLLTLPFNSGKNGYNGHKIYASIPYLINSDYVFFLDEDKTGHAQS